MEATTHTPRTRAATRMAHGVIAQAARGQNPADYLHHHAPAALWMDAEGHHCRAYGLQTPPARSRTGAAITWAHMTLLATERTA
ncbi:hypothetical protein [Roseovarius sp. MMSF_3281]|uniref:hypothetical protein n=1 Tax=Roseovarius sp. MMSF_3281 TaxID=3046694 RepID=UPI00273EEB26|nr:hypothetical protein [Roseovarius sp. MMSF_3281]